MGGGEVEVVYVIYMYVYMGCMPPSMGTPNPASTLTVGLNKASSHPVSSCESRTLFSSQFEFSEWELKCQSCRWRRSLYAFSGVFKSEPGMIGVLYVPRPHFVLTCVLFFLFFKSNWVSMFVFQLQALRNTTQT